MPLYECVCKVCGKHFEVRRSIKENYIIRCPICKGEARQTYSVNMNLYPIKNVVARSNGQVIWEA